MPDDFPAHADNPDSERIRINVFDAEGLTYRYAVTAEDTAGTIVQVEFELVD